MLFVAGKTSVTFISRRMENLGVWNLEPETEKWKNGKVGNTETSSAMKYFSIYNLRWRLISYQLLRHYQDIFKLGN